ncbi:MAG: GNAT family N-acetyltransferase [Dermatophilaceae bacterium]
MALPTPALETRRLRLRPFTRADREDLFSLHANARVMRYWDSVPWHDSTRADQFLARCTALEEQGSGARVAIERRDDGAFIGWCGLQRWDPDNRTANLGYVLTEETWGHGFATEAAAALLTWAFETLGLNRVEAQADTRNNASARVLEKLGFVLEGTLREHVIVDGEVSDDWTFSLLRSEWSGS